jgi:hypothetical protein
MTEFNLAHDFHGPLPMHGGLRNGCASCRSPLEEPVGPEVPKYRLLCASEHA